MEFLNVNFLWNLIWVLPLFFILALLATQRRKKFLISVLGKKYSNSEYVNLSHNKRSFKVWLLIGIAAFLIIAASRPYWGYKILPFSGSGKDILAVIDVSKSMLSKDIPPSRLEHAKLLLKNLIKNTPGDRYGIIAFAGSAFLECPLTIDRTSLFSILKDINIDSIPVGGTNIEKALKTAVKAFKAAAGGYKAIILITDGDELQGSSENVIVKLKELKTPLLVVGIGDPSKPGLIQLSTKDGQSKFLKDSKGELVKSKLNETQLKKLAEATNGVYIRSTAIDPGLNMLEEKISLLIPEKYENGKMTRPLEKYQLPLLIVVILMFIWLCVGEVKRKNNNISKTGKTAAVFILTALLVIFNYNTKIYADDQIPQNNNLEGQKPLQISKETPQTVPANSILDNTNIEDKKTPLETFNMGVAAHEKGETETATKNYTDAINSAGNNKDIRSKAYQNMGVIQHTAARKIMMQNPEESLKILDKAENLYKEAMRRDTLRQDTAANQQLLINDRKKAKEIIKRRKEMEKKRNEARQKTQEALQKQQQANKEEQQKQQNSKTEQKKQQDKNEQQKQKSQQQKKQDKDQKQKQQNKEEQQSKREQQSQQQQNEQQQEKSNQLQKEANRKTQEAQKAMQDYKEAAKQNNSQKDMQAAQSASNDITNARQNQRTGKSKDAEKNLQEALNKLGGQSQQNKNNNQQKQPQNNQGKNQQNKNKNQQTQQNKNRAEEKTKEALNQQQQANQAKGQDKKEKQQKANQKTKEAKNAMNDYKKSAEQNNNPKDKEKAEKAKQNLQNAQQSQKNNDGQKAEEQLKKALENLKGKNDNKQKDMPQQPQAKPMQPKYDNKDIDPKQAEALLKLMANEEKSLKDELKKRQKSAYGNMYIDKDW